MSGSKNRRPSVALVQRWIKDSLGQGEGVGYKPFMRVRDVPSHGLSSMVRSPVTGRTHHYLSKHEFAVHLLAEYAPRILDIREQYALLPWDETQSIAAQLGIKHPIIPGTQTPAVLTTDLLLSLKEPDGIRLVAVCVKLTNDLKPRTLEKLLLERLYWNRRGIQWFLATEKNLPLVRAQNLAFFENACRNTDVERCGVPPHDFATQFEDHWASDRSYIQILRSTCDVFGLDVTLGHKIVGAAVWKRQSRIDIDSANLSHNAPVALRQ